MFFRCTIFFAIKSAIGVERERPGGDLLPHDSCHRPEHKDCLPGPVHPLGNTETLLLILSISGTNPWFLLLLLLLLLLPPPPPPPPHSTNPRFPLLLWYSPRFSSTSITPGFSSGIHPRFLLLLLLLVLTKFLLLLFILWYSPQVSPPPAGINQVSPAPIHPLVLTPGFSEILQASMGRDQTPDLWCIDV